MHALSDEWQFSSLNWKQLTSAQFLQQGAEATLYAGIFLGEPTIIKERVSKKYRHPILDAELNTKRLKNEVRTMSRAQKSGVRTPYIYFVDKDNHLIFMESIDGLTLNYCLTYLEDKTEFDRLIAEKASKSHDGNLNRACYSNAALYDQQRIFKMLEKMISLGINTKDIARKLGSIIAKLHKNSLVHGDLTTSNIMLTAKDMDVVLIDFGLGMTSSQVECYAVDLYVLERAFSATHPGFTTMYQQILEAYSEAGMEKVIRRLDDGEEKKYLLADKVGKAIKL